MENYVVQPDETLEKIAEKRLGNRERWYEIARLNNIESPYMVFVGQIIKLPNKIVAAVPEITPPPITEQSPATMALARGFMFVVFEQLPNVGADKVIRKVAVIPKDYSLIPKNPLANYSLGEHAFEGEKINT